MVAVLAERARKSESGSLVFLLLAERAPSEGKKGGHRTILLARRAPTIKRWSLDARSEGQSGDSSERQEVGSEE
jgi:hypothetical protein